MAQNSNGQAFEKTYIGKGKQIKDFDMVEVSIDLEEAMACAHDYKGRKYLTFTVAKLTEPDQYGKTHTCFYTKKVKDENKKGE